MQGAYQVKMWVEVFSETCVLFQSNKTGEMPRDNHLFVVDDVKVRGVHCIRGIVVGILWTQIIEGTNFRQ